MKLLHDFFRLHLAGRHVPFVRDGTALPEFSVTVPAPLKKPVEDQRVCATIETTRMTRREPASFLKSPRHRRRAASR